MPSLSRITLEERRQNFGAGKILPKENRYFKGQNNYTPNYYYIQIEYNFYKH